MSNSAKAQNVFCFFLGIRFVVRPFERQRLSAADYIERSKPSCASQHAVDDAAGDNLRNNGSALPMPATFTQ
jgi:hypothetical protein